MKSQILFDSNKKEWYKKIYIPYPIFHNKY